MIVSLIRYHLDRTDALASACLGWSKNDNYNRFIWTHHEADAHVIRLFKAIVFVRVLAKANENCVDRHLQKSVNFKQDCLINFWINCIMVRSSNGLDYQTTKIRYSQTCVQRPPLGP
jgi:hypothetical protein